MVRSASGAHPEDRSVQVFGKRSAPGAREFQALLLQQQSVREDSDSSEERSYSKDWEMSDSEETHSQ